MSRNRDGSSDKGQIEGHDIIHGATGDKTLQHTKHVAPMPEVEAGDSLPGVGGGGVADITQGDSEEFGATAPRKERHGEDGESTTQRTTPSDTASRPSEAKRQKTSDAEVSSSLNNTSSSHSSSGTGLQADSVSGAGTGHQTEAGVGAKSGAGYGATSGSESESANAKAEEYAEEHGAEDKSKKTHEKHGEHQHGHAHGGKSHEKGEHGSSKHEHHDKHESGSSPAGNGNKLDQVQRHQAEKFGSVNLDNE